ncbi:MAG: hypothetical protein M1831_001810 [Alyxoria varia]|nr:MAG: hypothetical protein M1831_001810 [Alyxoria varia]
MNDPDWQWPAESEWPNSPPTYARKEKQDSPAKHYRIARRPSQERLKNFPDSSFSSTPSNGIPRHTPGSSSNTTPYRGINSSASPLGSKSSASGIKNEYGNISQSGSSTPQSDDSIEILFHNNKTGSSADDFERKLRQKLEKQRMVEQQLAQRTANFNPRHNVPSEFENKHGGPENRFSNVLAPVKQELNVKKELLVKKALPPQYDGAMKESDSDDFEMISPEQFQASANRAAGRPSRPRLSDHRGAVDDHYGVYNTPGTMYQPQFHQTQPHQTQPHYAQPHQTLPHHRHPHQTLPHHSQPQFHQPLDFGSLLNRQPNPQFPSQYVQSQTPQQPSPGSFHVPGAYFNSEFMSPPTNQAWNLPMPPTMPDTSNWNPLHFDFDEDDSSDMEITHYGSVDQGRSWDDMIEDLQTNGLAYMANDPSKNKEEIEALLANIRPDEDLPSHLTQGNPEGLRVNLMNHQRVGLSWLLEQEKGTNRGGILADDMGLGKTIQALSLILSNPSEDPSQKTTLIIAPVALMEQWAKEILDKVKPGHRLKVCVFHGAKKNKLTYAHLSQYDVVITTFGNLTSELKRKENHEKAIFAGNAAPASTPREPYKLIGELCKWHRVIIDEAQNIKNPRAKSAQAATWLTSRYRLCMTGTPMMNHVGELYSLIRFLRIKPYNQIELFNSTFMKPLKSNSASARKKAMSQLQVVIKAIMLRRTKDSKINDEPILNLPERNTEEVHATFDDHQREMYDALQKQSSLKVNKFLKAGTMMNNYSYILVLLLRLRQACCHPHLIPDLEVPIEGELPPEKMESLAEDLSENVVNMIKVWAGAMECPICYDATDSPLLFHPCGHGVCSECFVQLTEKALAEGQSRGFQCPQCRNHVEASKVIKWSVFEKIHIPKKEDQAEGIGLLGEAPAVSSAGSDSSDTEDEYEVDEVDSKGNLKNFVVESDNDDDYSEPTDSKKRKRNPIKKEASEKKSPPKKKKKLTLAELKKESMRSKAARAAYLKRLRKGFKSSAKIDKTVEILSNIHNKDPTEKTIVFSQFTTLLDLVEIPLQDHSWGYRRYDGGMTPKDRNKAVEDFYQDPDIKIMLVSLKAGNAGLNLNKASQVIILDPFWNPYIEDQAIDRAHRIGQLRNVDVHRILVENTIEDRIMQLQENKRKLVNEALDEKTGKGLSRLGRDELVYLFVSDRN